MEKQPLQNDRPPKLAWCEKCCAETEYFVHKTRRYGSYEGRRYRYKGKKANCTVCGAAVFVPEVIEYDIRRLCAMHKKFKQKEESPDGEQR